MQEELRQALEQALTGEVKKLVLSNPRGGAPYVRVTAQCREGGYDVSRYTQKQAFHQRLGPQELFDYCAGALETEFKQLNCWTDRQERMLKLSKKGKCTLSTQAVAAPPKVQLGHDRVKQYRLPEGEVVPPLVDMGVFTKEGRVAAQMQDKFRQINKFLELVEDAVDKAGLTSLRIIDFGCGKSYLTFVVYYYLHEKKKLDVQMIGLDLKAEVIEKCNAAAQKYGYEQLHFAVGDINGYQADGPVDMVLSLHACDTATDYALFNAIRWKARIILSVPCCQHELCAQLDSPELALVQRYGIVKERTAALFTDAIRGNLVECCGYKVQLLEFVDLSHTPKNILIRAVRANVTAAHRKKLLAEVDALTACFSLQPTLLRLLRQSGLLPGQAEPQQETQE